MKILLGTDILLYYIKNLELVDGISILFTWINRIKAKQYIDVSSIAILTHFIPINAFKELGRFGVLKFFRPKTDAIMALEKDILNSKYKHEVSLRPLLAQLNCLACNDVDVLITENKELHYLSSKAGIDDRVYYIEEFIERMCVEHKDLDDTRGVDIQKVKFGSLDFEDKFFDSFKADYDPYYHVWLRKKADDDVYIAKDRKGNLRGLLKLKCEGAKDDVGDIVPRMQPAKRLKVSSLKAHFTGQKLGQRFMRIVFDTAIKEHVDEIYITLFENSKQKRRLVGMIEQWGFVFYGYKDGAEQVYIRDFSKKVGDTPCLSFPFHSLSNGVFLIPIYRSYASLLIPPFGKEKENADLELRKYAIKKSLVLREDKEGIREGTVLLFFQKSRKGLGQSLTAVGVVECVRRNCVTEQMFVNRCKKRSVLSNSVLHDCWIKSGGMAVVIDFLYVCHIHNPCDFLSLKEIGIDTDDFHSQHPIQISEQQYRLLIKGTEYEKTFVVDKA